MQKLPRISIVTPSYNQAQFLERTIISVLNQNYPNLEYIIIDGGSTDGSVEIIRKYEKYLAYWFSEADQGQSDALNKGFDKSTGEILAWLNSDDMYLPNALFNVARSFVKNPDAALIYGDYIKVDADDRCFALRRQPSFDYQVCLHAYTMPIQPASFFNREAFFSVGGLNINLHYTMDYDLILRLARYGRVVHANEYVAALRFHKDCKTLVRQQTRGKVRFPSPEVRRPHLRRPPLPGEFFVLTRYHAFRIFLRMLKEGCLPSRFGRDRSEYALNQIYTPRLDDHYEEIS